MKTKFKKIMSVAGSVFLVGSTIGMAAAAGGLFPAPFIKDNNAEFALVYGSNSAASDLTAVNSINDYLKTFSQETSNSSTSNITNDFTDSVGMNDNEIPLGELITANDFNEVLKDNKIATLFDGKIQWDNGIDSTNYDLHEEINISGLRTQTTLDENELKSSVVLENDQSLTYKLVFDDKLNTSLIDTEDADELYLTILGQEYEIIEMDVESITVSLTTQKIVNVGETFTVDGITLKVDDIFEDCVEINGKLIDEGRTKKVNGIEVYVEQIAYHSSIEGYTNKAILKVGTDIERTFDDGDEYTEEWEWTIKNPGDKYGFIGVKYMRNSVGYDEDDELDNAISVGGSYVFPENYAAVLFNGLTDVNYEDFELVFDSKKLYNNDSSSTENVVMLSGENDDSFELDNSWETDSIYLKYSTDNVSIYFKDINGDVDDDHEGRIQYFDSYNFGLANESDKVYNDIAKLIVEDTKLDLGLVLTNTSEVILTLDNIEIPLGTDNTDFDRLGDKEEDADSTDLIVGDVNIGTQENDVLDYYGIIYESPEYNADKDQVMLSVPGEQVYADISVAGLGMEVVNEVETNNSVVDLGGVIVKDTEVNNVQDKNLIIVGGSCINTLAAQLLGGTACGEEFTLKTGVIPGKALIKSFASPYNAEKVAVVVAGYEAGDTTRAAGQIVNSNLDLSVGQMHTV